MELWLPVVGYEGRYEVSSHGRVKSFVARGGTTVLAASPDEFGYPTVGLHKGGRQTVKRVHLIVLRAFVGPCPNGQEGCHNDGVPTNNRLDNLRYDTRGGNLNDKRAHGTHIQGEMAYQAILTEADVRVIKELLKTGHAAWSLAKHYGVVPETIYAIKHGRSWKHVLS